MTEHKTELIEFVCPHDPKRVQQNHFKEKKLRENKFVLL